MIDLVIFDCDGVLVDSEVIGGQVCADYLTAHGLPHTLEQCTEYYLGISDKAVFEIITNKGGVLPASFCADLDQLTVKRLAETLDAIPGIAQLLEQLEVPVCVASSGTPEKIHNSLKKTNLADHFGRHIFSAVQVEHGKPAPDLFLLAASEMGIDPAHAIVVEDSIAGVQAGVAAGMQVVGFTGGSHLGPEHGKKLRDRGAHYVTGDIANLLDIIENSV